MRNNAGRKKWCWVSQATSSLIVFWRAALGNALADGAQGVLESKTLTQMHQGRCFCARAARRAGMHLYGKWWGAEEIGILSCKVQRENSEHQGESREWTEQEKTDVKGFVSCLSKHTGWNHMSKTRWRSTENEGQYFLFIWKKGEGSFRPSCGPELELLLYPVWDVPTKHKVQAYSSFSRWDMWGNDCV